MRNLDFYIVIAILILTSFLLVAATKSHAAEQENLAIVTVQGVKELAEYFCIRNTQEAGIKFIAENPEDTLAKEDLDDFYNFCMNTVREAIQFQPLTSL